MSLRRRLARVEALVEGLLTVFKKQCRTCGRGMSHERLVVLLQGDEQLGECSHCGLPVGPDGEAVGSLEAAGEVSLKVVRLSED